MEKNHSNSANPSFDLKYRRKKNAEEMRHQVISFTLMILLTLVAFAAVGFEYSRWYTIPVLILLAVVQVAFQLYYFMHMKHKGHGAIALFLYSGLAVGLITVLAFVTIVWI